MNRIKPVVPYILALASFLITYYIDPLNFTEKNAYAAIPSLSFSILIYIISSMFDIKSLYEKSILYSDNTLNAVKKHLKVTVIGTPTESMGYIIERLSVAKEVLNTSFNLEKEEGRERAEEQFYSSDKYQNFICAIKKFSNHGKYWKDVGDINAKNRFREINKECNNNFYKFKITSNNVPQINFLILIYENNTREVLFNWNYGMDINDPMVLSSTDDQILDMFIRQHANLWRNATNDYDNP